MKRMIINAALGDNWVRRDDEGTVVSTNAEGYQLVHCDDRSLNTDVFHWKVLDPDGNVVLDTGRLYYGYDICYSIPEEHNHHGHQYADAIYLKCISDKYGFNDSDVIALLNTFRYGGARERYKSTCGLGYDYKFDQFGWANEDKVSSALEGAKSSGLINQFMK